MPHDSPPRLLLRTGWQDVNIGDVGHAVGLIDLLRGRFPEAALTLWPIHFSDATLAWFRRTWPELRIVRGSLDETGATDSAELRQVLPDADFLLHGSGASIHASELLGWSSATDGKPYATFGNTVDPLGRARGGDPREALNDRLLRALTGARAVFGRESRTVALLGDAGIQGPRIAWGPDTTFALTTRDDEAGDAFLKSAGLLASPDSQPTGETARDRRQPCRPSPLQPEKPGEPVRDCQHPEDPALSPGGQRSVFAATPFLVVVPRLRVTPYHRIRPESGFNRERAREIDALNAQHAEPDCAVLRDVITTWIEETGHPVLLAPEMTYQVEMFGPLILEKLPAAIRQEVRTRDTWWGPAEAASVYRHAAAVVSAECHSPILAFTQGVPGIYLRQPSDTVKGTMYPDLGLDDWLEEIESADGAAVARKVIHWTGNPEPMRRRMQAARDQLDRCFAEYVEVVCRAIDAGR